MANYYSTMQRSADRRFRAQVIVLLVCVAAVAALALDVIAR